MAEGSPLRPESVLARSRRAVHGELPEETVLVDLETGRSLRLNATAAWLWRRLEEPVAVATLAEELAEAYSVGPRRAEQDVSAFADDLVRRGLLEVIA